MRSTSSAPTPAGSAATVPVSSAAGPPARRLTAPRWRDARLVLGVVVVLLSVLAGARAVAAADRTAPVWVADTDLAAGSTLKGGDLVVRQVRLDAAGAHYLAASGAPPVGAVLSRAVAAGELIPASALSTTGGKARRQVTVPVEQFHAPDGLARGQRVDVYVTPRAEDGQSGPATLVLAGAVVDDVQQDGGRFSSNRSSGVVLSVEPPAVGRVVAGVRRGTVDLVGVPAGTP